MVAGPLAVAWVATVVAIVFLIIFVFSLMMMGGFEGLLKGIESSRSNAWTVFLR
jgi:hypothetical protein